jgi:hypothetical protein
MTRATVASTAMVELIGIQMRRGARRQRFSDQLDYQAP